MPDPSTRREETDGIHVQKTVTIDRPPLDIYEFWRNFANLSRFMESVESVQSLDAGSVSRWKVRGPAGRTVEWDAEVVEDVRGVSIGWRAIDDAGLQNAGTVVFQPSSNGRGTEVTVKLAYRPASGRVSDWVALLFGRDPSQQLSKDLRRLKALLETGEIPTASVSVLQETVA